MGRAGLTPGRGGFNEPEGSRRARARGTGSSSLASVRLLGEGGRVRGNANPPAADLDPLRRRGRGEAASCVGAAAPGSRAGEAVVEGGVRW